MRGKRDQEEDALIGCLNLGHDNVQWEKTDFDGERMKKLCVNTRLD